MTDLYFTYQHKQHWMRILRVDDKPDHVAVYECLLDGREYIYFESQLSDEGTISESSLFADALVAYMEHDKDDTVAMTRWRDEEG